jgi:hypothetical protein
MAWNPKKKEASRAGHRRQKISRSFPLSSPSLYDIGPDFYFIFFLEKSDHGIRLMKGTREIKYD